MKEHLCLKVFLQHEVEKIDIGLRFDFSIAKSLTRKSNIYQGICVVYDEFHEAILNMLFT